MYLTLYREAGGNFIRIFSKSLAEAGNAKPYIVYGAIRCLLAPLARNLLTHRSIALSDTTLTAWTATSLVTILRTHMEMHSRENTAFTIAFAACRIDTPGVKMTVYDETRRMTTMIRFVTMSTALQAGITGFLDALKQGRCGVFKGFMLRNLSPTIPLEATVLDMMESFVNDLPRSVH
jgi:hypothetical protein